MREQRLIERVSQLTTMYSFDQPFASFLQNHFRLHPEMGSRDRRFTREWCFNFFRIGKNLEELEFSERLAVANFLCTNESSRETAFLLQNYSKLPVEKISLPLLDKKEIINSAYSFSEDKIFPMQKELSSEIEKNDWSNSFLVKPLVWIRIKQNHLENVLSELRNENIEYETDINEYTLSFKPEISLQNLKSFGKGYFEIQDKSSQLTGDWMNPGDGELWWDACAGSGGKSLLLKEKNSSVQILATDLRPVILKNYTERLKKSNQKGFKTMSIDLNVENNIEEQFDGIIADVPCSGSGTWARSPEWLQKDSAERLLDHYVPLQRNIITNAVKNLKKGFPLLFITCSVFSKENEENVRYFHEHLPLKLKKSLYLKGYHSRADTLYIAEFTRI